MNIRCALCGVVSRADTSQVKLLEGARVRGQRFVAVECPDCFKTFGLDPCAPGTIIAPEKQETLRCPLTACTGRVSLIDGAFWGCAECGPQWDTRDALEAAIRRAMARFPHRRAVYRDVAGAGPGTLTGVPVDAEPAGYEKRVEREED